MRKRLLPVLSAIFFLMVIMHTAFAEESMEEIIIPSPNGNVFGVLQLPEGKKTAPLIILSHGFGGNHTLDLNSAAFFVSAGFATYNLDFCGGGFNSRSSGTMLDMSVLTEAADLDAVPVGSQPGRVCFRLCFLPAARGYQSGGAGIPGDRAAG